MAISLDQNSYFPIFNPIFDFERLTNSIIIMHDLQLRYQKVCHQELKQIPLFQAFSLGSVATVHDSINVRENCSFHFICDLCLQLSGFVLQA